MNKSENINTNNSTDKYAAIYARVSTGKQARRTTPIEVQIELGIDKADKMGYDGRHKIYVDGGKSGGSLIIRTAMESIIKDIEAGIVEVVIFEDQSRMSRDVVDMALLVKVCKKYGVRLFSFCMEIDYITPEGRFMINQLSSANQLQRDLAQWKAIKGHIKLAEMGLYPWGGSPPYGFERNAKNSKELLIIEQNKMVLDKILDMRELGWTGTKITKWLQQSKIDESIKWSKNMVTKILNDSLYYGEIEVFGVVYKLDMDAMFTKKRWLRAINAPKTHVKEANHNYCFQRVFNCAKCNSNINVDVTTKKTTGKQYKYYVCPSCKDRASEDKLLKLLLNEIVNNYTLADISLELDPLKKELKNLNKKQKELHSYYMSNKIDIENYIDMHKKVSDDINLCNEKIRLLTLENNDSNTVSNLVKQNIEKIIINLKTFEYAIIKKKTENILHNYAPKYVVDLID